MHFLHPDLTGQDFGMAESRKTLEMQEITDETIIKVFRLARLDPDDPAMKGQIEHLRRILSHFSVLSQVQPDNPDQPVQPLPASLPFREDETGESLDIKLVLGNTVNARDGFFKAPGVPGGESDPA